ncbi:helix-turn-helix domain-containing protein [Jeotgalibacillus soli]|uniref:HTH cro/C1-type domain-containing protein n=1 Tax=Jeotgalibacillus soli TaxID=889306 RepID=A0A0C2VLZ1_9BACL|nr:helix-turn-helix transcriptional regulator [Jeotgalibacillus soli]KIL44998.1 hypothetical protein KP78_25420 [Jeotgalibacillus soli]
MNQQTELAKFIKEYREENDLTISALSELTGVSRPYLSQIENGKTPTKKTLEKMAEGMWKDEFQKMWNGPRLIEMAGYKLIPEEGEPGYDVYLKDQEVYEQMQNYERIIRFLEEDIKELSSFVELNKVFNEESKIILDNQHLTKNELEALRLLLKGIRINREEK